MNRIVVSSSRKSSHLKGLYALSDDLFILERSGRGVVRCRYFFERSCVLLTRMQAGLRERRYVEVW